MTQGSFASFDAQKYRSIFLSDFHMGAKSFDAKALLDFLKSTKCEYFFLAGDIIDGWKLKKRWYWTEDCNRVIDELVRKADEGTKIIFLSGNHDNEIRHILPLSKGRFAKKLGIKIRNQIVHTLADGRQFLILHGDQFDRKIIQGELSKWVDKTINTAREIWERLRPTTPQTILIKGVKTPFSLAKALKNKGKWALYLINNFEHAIQKTAHKREVDGIICGHTHIPTIKTLTDITYANAGSWVGTHHTALVESTDGTLNLIDWPASTDNPVLFDPILIQEPQSCKILPAATQYRPITMMIVKRIQDTWPIENKAPIIVQNAAQNLPNTTAISKIFKQIFPLKMHSSNI